MKSKTILVMLSSYNGEKYIRDQILSILNQKCMYKVNLLIRDDGSKDKTLSEIKKIQKEFDNIDLIEGRNIGYINSFFELINTSKDFDFYALSDQDDIWLENKLQKAIEAISKEKEDIPILYGSTSHLVDIHLKKQGMTQKQTRSITLLNTIIQNILPGHTQVMNNNMIKLLRKQKIDYCNIYVHDSWITNVACIKGKIIFDNNAYTLYRQHNSNEVGYGKGKTGWLIERFKRIKQNDNKKYAKQINYFYAIYKKDLDKIEKKEIKFFLSSQRNIVTRMCYVFRCKLYRQRAFETIMFKALYLIGGYKL